MLTNSLLRRFFRLLNKYFMTPMFRLGLGAFVGNPLSGYIMVLKTTGRKTRRVRYTPVNYAIMKGNVYCMAGFGKISDWFRNIQEHPEVEMILPSGRLAGRAEEVTDPDEALGALRQVLKNSGFAAFAAGLNPFTMPDEELSEKTKDFPAVRIPASGLRSGAGDAGGWLWMLELLIIVVGIIWLVVRQAR